MPLTMNREVFITCAVTGSGGTQDRSPHVPRSPQQIADSAIAAAKAGAAVVHCHVRDPETGKPSRDPALYREVTERIRDSATDVVLNLTAGMGGDMLFDGTEEMSRMSPRSDMAGADGAGGACGGVPAGDLHARLRHDELQRGRLCDGQHPGHAARHGARGWRRRGCGSRSRPSIPGICGSPRNWSRKASSRIRCWCSCAWACPGARRTI